MKRSRGARAEGMRREVRERYSDLAHGGGCCANGSGSGCCGGSAGTNCSSDASASRTLGYSAQELAGLPEGANLGLGCGNPTSLLALSPGQVVLDLGSGAGIDCFLAAQQVGPTGRVMGVDMTAAMVERARANARRRGYANVEFRLGEIEHLPVADRSVDVVLSNCVINLAPNKSPVYREAFRVLRPGGRLAVSDVVATRRISASDRADPSLWSSCSSGAIRVDALERLLRTVGFKEVRVAPKPSGSSGPTLRGQAALGVVPADITARRPVRARSKGLNRKRP